MTRELFYEDSHMREFDAHVLECAERDGFFEIVLDKTAFFPEGGGQPSDVGTLGDSFVSFAYQKDGLIYHRCDRPLPVGEEVHGQIDWPRRFAYMQNHTAEHIVSGIVHRRHGFSNVGFHMGADGVIVDFDGFVDGEELADIEREANEAVYRNVPVTARIPPKEELPALEYRSKLDLTENVRLVTIEGVDVCACCAPHVKRTGEIGVIKIFESIRRKAGVRLRMLAGSQGYLDYVKRARSVSQISALLSAPQDQVTEAVKRLMEERDAINYRLGGLKRQIIGLKAASMGNVEGNIVFFEPDFDTKELQLLANAALDRCTGIAAVLSGDDESGYRYVLASKSVDLRSAVKELNATLAGRGGGRPELVTGTLKATAREAERFIMGLGT